MFTALDRREVSYRARLNIYLRKPDSHTTMRRRRARMAHSAEASETVSR